MPSNKTAEGILLDLWECPVVATAALLKRESHITFLSGELVIFSLFNSKLSNAEKQEIAARLLTLQDLWQPGEMLIDIMTVPHPNFCIGETFWPASPPGLKLTGPA